MPLHLTNEDIKKARLKTGLLTMLTRQFSNLILFRTNYQLDIMMFGIKSTSKATLKVSLIFFKKNVFAQKYRLLISFDKQNVDNALRFVK